MPRNYKWIIIGTGFFSTFTIFGLARFAYPLILPSMRQSLQFNYTQMGLLNAGILVGYLFFSLLAGILANKFGNKQIIAISMLTISFSMSLIALSSSFYLLFLITFLMGAGIAGARIPMVSLVTKWVTRSQYGMAMGIISSGTGSGVMTAGYFIPIIGLEYNKLAWRYSWAFFAIVAFFVSTLCICLLKNKPDNLSQDKLLISSTRKIPSVKNNKTPLLKTIVLNRPLRIILFVYFLFGFAYNIFVTYYVSFLIDEIRINEQVASHIWVFFGIFSIVSGTIWGIISDRIGREITLMFSAFILSLSILLPIISRDLIYLYASAIFFGLNLLGFIIVFTAMVSELVESNMISIIIGFATFIHGVAQVIGSVFGGYLKDSFGGFQLAFCFSFFTMIVIIICLGFIKRTYS